jgi:multisubunit Na+/H+ antiporter MnhG subunit
MWHHGFTTVVSMTTCSIFGWYIIIFGFILIYFNDLKLNIKKYHLLLRLIEIDNAQFLMIMMWHAMCQYSVTTNNQPMIYDTNFNKIALIS